MKLLLSCVNTVVSFIGYDLVQKKAFWYCPADRVRACGAAYDFTSGSLLVSTDNELTSFPANGEIIRTALPGPHENLAHSVHVLEDLGIGVADTGNSRLLLFGPDRKAFLTLNPLEGWQDVPKDALHLNDFVLTPEGVVASCFNYQPFRAMEFSGYRWQTGGHGLLLSLKRFQGRTLCRILAGGLNCPHSLCWHKDSLYCCSSATGDFLRFAYSGRGQLEEKGRVRITTDHFLRGVLPLEDGGWVLGGSAVRRADGHGMALFRLDAGGAIETLPVAAAGEIYDILPWEAAIMEPVADRMADLPSLFGDGESEYPAPCALDPAYRASV